jgi:hypothetical protein
VKNPTALAALVLVGLAALVGGLIWATAGGDPTGDSQPITATTNTQEVGFSAISPRERRKKVNMETTKRELKRIRETGEEVAPNLYMIPDDNGDPTYYYAELIEGRGRGGEPLYMTAKLKRRQTVPLIDPKGHVAPHQPSFKREKVEGVLNFGKPTEEGGGESPGASANVPGDGSAGGGGGSGKDG